MSQPQQFEPGSIDDDSQIASRAYQLEMFDASIDNNIIVVMDTGSGKTHVAVLRIKYALDHDKQQKLIWFLAPTIALCIQQHTLLQATFPTISVRLITGSDNVERGRSQVIWDKVLSSRVIVSTHQILADALSHGFLRIERIGLLIFDEAHHCAKEHPGNRLMREHYHASQRRDDLPRVLGLTASPINRSRVTVENLQELERNLQSVCKSPREHRSELRKYVHLPKLTSLVYESNSQDSSLSCLRGLENACASLSIINDPYVIKLKSNPHQRDLLQKVLETGKTNCSKALKRFIGKLAHVHKQLGGWAADEYFRRALVKLEESCGMRKQMMLDWEDDEKEYLLKVLKSVPCPLNGPTREASIISPKVEILLRFVSQFADQQTSGIIFVEQRATAAVLSTLLAIHPLTSRFTCSSFVGTSNHASRKTELGDLVDRSLQSDVLDEFKSGKCGLVIATGVLEEGIDVSSCNLVICFDKPPNVKSFIQRRGRARDPGSNFVLMLDTSDSLANINKLRSLEEEMGRMYRDEQRYIDDILRVEERLEQDGRCLRVEATGAILTVNDAMSCLNKFCSALPRNEFVNPTAIFQFHERADGFLQATLLLPSGVDSTLRQRSGTGWWLSERQAKKDAAFEALTALYEAGMLDDHLVPVPRLVSGFCFPMKQMPSKKTVNELLNPWIDQARRWAEQPGLGVHPIQIRVSCPDRRTIELLLLCPTMNEWIIPSCSLYWTAADVGTSTFEWRHGQVISYNKLEMEQLKMANDLILRSIHRFRMSQDDIETCVLLAPFLEPAKIERWLDSNSGVMSADEVQQRGPPYGIVRHPSAGLTPNVFQAWLLDNTIEVLGFPRRRNFLQPNETRPSRKSQIQRTKDTSHETTPQVKSKQRVLPIEGATFDKLPRDYVTFAMLVPSLEHHITRYFVAAELCSTLLAPVTFGKIDNIMSAITASSAFEMVNYQHLEFIGDTVLKYMVSTQLFIKHDMWHEGYLSRAKSSLVANSTLAAAAIDKGLPRYIFTAQLSPRKWKPLYVQELLRRETPPMRKMSTKIIADVLEALIGAAFEEGGIAKAASCVDVFLDWELTKVFHASRPLFSLKLVDRRAECRPQQLHMLQEIIGHRFHDLSLLVEATNHPSQCHDTFTSSYQRLEFLGDAVLDMIIVSKLATVRPELSHMDMHLIKTALVNDHLLAFLCMDLATEQDDYTVTTDISLPEPQVVKVKKKMVLCDFMACDSFEILKARRSCSSRYETYQSDIREAIQVGKAYPWSLLLRLGVPKFMSDVIESTLGAIFVDSKGDLELCERFLTKLGLMAYLARILQDSVDVVHPKSALNEVARNKVKFRISREEQGFKCFAEIGETQYPEVSGGLSKEEITTRAAETAYHKILEP